MKIYRFDVSTILKLLCYNTNGSLQVFKFTSLYSFRVKVLGCMHRCDFLNLNQVVISIDKIKRKYSIETWAYFILR